MAKSVLIVDDSNVVRSIVRLFLETLEGCMVVGEAGDGVEAVVQAQELRPDLILLDLAMPRMNGVEAASVIKKMMPESKIILFSMYGEEVGKTLTKASGIDDVVSKPEGVGNLIKHLQAFLENEESDKSASQLPSADTKAEGKAVRQQTFPNAGPTTTGLKLKSKTAG